MLYLVFNQRAYLPIHQPVKLRHQNEMITIFPMLSEKTVPLVPVFCIPRAAVKDKLAFIDHNPGLPFYDVAVRFSLMAKYSKIYKPVCGQFMILLVKKYPLGLRFLEGMLS